MKWSQSYLAILILFTGRVGGKKIVSYLLFFPYENLTYKWIFLSQAARLQCMVDPSTWLALVNNAKFYLDLQLTAWGCHKSVELIFQLRCVCWKGERTKMKDKIRCGNQEVLDLRTKWHWQKPNSLSSDIWIHSWPLPLADFQGWTPTKCTGGYRTKAESSFFVCVSVFLFSNPWS